VAGIKQVVGNEDIMLISNTGNIIRLHVDEISVLHRNTQGVKLIDIAPGRKSRRGRADGTGQRQGRRKR